MFLKFLKSPVFAVNLMAGCMVAPITLVIMGAPAFAQSQTELEAEIEQFDFENGISNDAPASTQTLEEEAEEEIRYDGTALNNAPYEKEILRLSEIMGAMHFLNKICPANMDKNWRGAMGNIINTERAAAKYRSKLTANFNRGFLAYQTSYKTCTPNAKRAIEKYVAEGAALTETIVNRFGRQ